MVTPVARSPVYSVPYIGRRTEAKGALVRGPSGGVEQVFVGGAGMTCREIERRAIEAAREDGVPQTDRNIKIIEQGG